MNQISTKFSPISLLAGASLYRRILNYVTFVLLSHVIIYIYQFRLGISLWKWVLASELEGNTDNWRFEINGIMGVGVAYDFSTRLVLKCFCGTITEPQKCFIAGFHMTSLKFKLQNYWSRWYFTLMRYKSSWKLIFMRIFVPNRFLVLR